MSPEPTVNCPTCNQPMVPERPHNHADALDQTHSYGDGCDPPHVDTGAPSCHRRHICAGTDARVAEAAREYAALLRGAQGFYLDREIGGLAGARRRLLDAVKAQCGDADEP